MKPNLRLFRAPNSLWFQFLEFNPQFFREIKGKLKTRNMVITAALAVITQFVVMIALLSKLPDSDPARIGVRQYSRYCWDVCTQDLMDNWVVNWQLLWLDSFIIFSIIGVLALLILGTYMLIADTVQEENRGTLNFIRLSPQSASSILLGKILGVPILLYSGVLLLLPLHLASGLQAHIPIALIVAFYGVVVASCGFFYSLALLWSLTKLGFPSLKPWLGSGVLGFLLLILTKVLLDGAGSLNNPLGWLFLFNPALALSYLIDATSLPSNQIDFFTREDLSEMLFLGQALWTKASIGISTIIFHFGLWTYWCWKIAQRRFLNPDRTLISKTQSYWLTGCFVTVALGFTLQSTRQSLLAEYFIFLQFCLGVWGLGLIAALSPHRQALYDWARYRHQVRIGGNVLWKELIWGENSPSTVAIAINLFIGIIYIIPSVLIHLKPSQYHLLWGFVLSAEMILLLAVITQLILTSKNRKRGVWSIITVASLVILPSVFLGLADFHPQTAALPWLFGFVPTAVTEYAAVPSIFMAVMGQWLAIALISLQMTRKLKQAGASETKILLERNTLAIDRSV